MNPWAAFFILLIPAALFLERRPWLSRLVRKPNQKRKFGEADAYLGCTVWHEGVPVSLLMTQSEFAKLRDRAAGQPEEFNNAN